jgi:hypothetical protein
MSVKFLLRLAKLELEVAGLFCELSGSKYLGGGSKSEMSASSGSASTESGDGDGMRMVGDESGGICYWFYMLCRILEVAGESQAGGSSQDIS